MLLQASPTGHISFHPESKETSFPAAQITGHPTGPLLPLYRTHFIVQTPHQISHSPSSSSSPSMSYDSSVPLPSSTHATLRPSLPFRASDIRPVPPFNARVRSIGLRVFGNCNTRTFLLDILKHLYKSYMSFSPLLDRFKHELFADNYIYVLGGLH